MTDGLLQYSGLLAKTKAMEGKLLSEQEIEALSKAESRMRTEELNRRLTQELHNDYKRLYQIAGRKQKEELALFAGWEKIDGWNNFRRKGILSDRRTKEIFNELMKAERERKNLLFLYRKQRFREQGASGIPIEEIRKEQMQWEKKMDGLYRKLCHKYPVSIAPVLYYLYRKQKEREAIVTAAEEVHLWSKS